MVLWVIIDNHERTCILHTQADIRRAVVFACACAAANHLMYFRGVELAQTVVTRIFHAATLFKMMIYENMKPIVHVLLHPICVLFHLMCVSKNCNVKLALYYWTHWSCRWIYHFKTQIKAIFHNQTKTPRSTKKQIWLEEKLNGSPGHMQQNACCCNLKWTFEDLLPCYCYAIKIKSTTILWLARFATCPCRQSSGYERNAKLR